MIPVQPQPEPPEFDRNVRRPGLAFLRHVPNPTSWKKKSYWQESLNDLYDAYGGICAYSAEWISRISGGPTVDHYVPKSVQPPLAYEWGNFRLCAMLFNQRKDNYQDVIDPFTVAANWFNLDIPSLLIKPAGTLAPFERERVNATVKRLKLNDENCIGSRLRWIMSYCRSELTFEYLRKHAPFIAYELERQGLVQDIVRIMQN